MNAVIKASVVLAVLVAVLSLALGLSGMHQSNPMLYQLLFLVLAILINVGCIFWGLRMTAAENGYLKQLLNGALIGLLGGVLIFGFSVLLLTVLMPDHLAELKESMIDFVESAPLPDDRKAAQIEQIRNTTAVSQSIGGLVGTFFTSLIAAAIVAIFQRRK